MPVFANIDRAKDFREFSSLINGWCFYHQAIMIFLQKFNYRTWKKRRVNDWKKDSRKNR